MSKVQISLTDVVNHLKNGVTRKITSKYYNPEIGSIEEKYGLPAKQVDKLFKHPELTGKKVIPVVEDMFEIIDESPVVSEESTDNSEMILTSDNIDPVEPVGQLWSEDTSESSDNEAGLDVFTQ